MNISIEAADLLRLFDSAAACAGLKSPMQILSYVLLAAKGDELTALSTDLEQSILLSAPCVAVTPGEVCLPVKPVLDLLKKAKSEQLGVAYDERAQVVTLSGKRLKYQFPTLPACEHPGNSSRMGGSGESVEVPAKVLSIALAAIQSVPASREESRAALRCVHFLGGHGWLELRASDGCRAMVLEVETDGEYVETTLKHNVPPDFIKVLQKNLKGLEDADQVVIGWSSGGEELVVKLPACSLYTRCLGGVTYPDLDRAWIKPTVEMTGNVGEWSASLERIILVQEQKDMPPTVVLQPGEEELDGVKIDLSAADQQGKNGNETAYLSADVAGQSLDVATVRTRYLLDAITALPVESFTVGHNMTGWPNGRRHITMNVRQTWEQNREEGQAAIRARTIIMEIKKQPVLLDSGKA